MTLNELDQKIKDRTLTETELEIFAKNSRTYLNTISDLIELEEKGITEDELESHKVLIDSISNIEKFCLKGL